MRVNDNDELLTSAIDHASNRSIERDVVQIKLCCGNFLGIFLREVASREQILLSELGVVVESHLGVERKICELKASKV